ncbi:MAG: hypothetical protein R3C02_09195 [Planctomycetaceae bacterium]
MTDAETSTIAGTGEERYFGDGGQAVKAGVSGPFGIAVGPDGAPYICEIGNHVIRSVDLKTGLITTVAGTGEPGYAGDGGPATQAKLKEPYEVRFDHDGNMLFVEMLNNLFAGLMQRPASSASSRRTGELGFSGDGGPATYATLNRPSPITPGHVGTICDIGNHRGDEWTRRRASSQHSQGPVNKHRHLMSSISGTPLTVHGPRL